MIFDFDLEKGDAVKFNDEPWIVKACNEVDDSVTMQSMSGRLQTFEREEMKKNILMSGEFVRLKKDHLDNL